MCGLTGFILSNTNTVSLEDFQKMNRSMLLRGPDAEGYYLKNGKIGLASRRLKITDLSDTANMPLSNEDNTIHMVFNGAIYNFQAIRDTLIKEGHVFKTKSDTEIIVHSYEKWGNDYFSKFNGMFAIAIWDENKQKLIISRDRIGIKPLYYYHVSGVFAFASELKPIVNFPLFKKEINRDALYTYISLHNIPAPLSIFSNVYKLEPGKYLEYQNGEMKIVTYWDMKDTYKPITIYKTTEEYVNEIEELLVDSVKQMLICDVPLGAFLSGGIDSSLLVAIMSGFSNAKLKSYTIGFDDKKVNEAVYAKGVADYLGIEHHELYLNQKDIVDILPNVPEYFDEPFGDVSLLPTLLLSKFARKDITVTLSGDGADEFFAGYPRFTKIGELFNPAKTYQLNTIALFSKLSKNILTGKYKKIAQVFASKKLEDTYTYMMGHISQDELMKLSMNSYFSYGSEIAKYPQGNMDTESYIYYLLAKRYLPETVLNKTDRATMAYSLEARVPFLDHRLVEYAGTIPFKMKTQNGTSKFLLRQLLNKYIPKSLTDRPKKGFDVPLDWRKKDLNDIAKHYFDFNKIKNEGFFDPKEVKKLLDDHVNGKMNNGIRLWILLNFELCLEKYG